MNSPLPHTPSTLANIDRREFVARLLAATPDALVITGLGSPTYDVYASGDQDRYFYLWGAMGGALPLGLGLALAQPQRPVLVITGDGEQLMGMGAMATAAAQNPSNLSVVVLDNGHFGETGMQRSHTSLGTRLVEVAKACGIARARDRLEATQGSQVKGKLRYMAPEQIKPTLAGSSGIDHRIDLFAAGTMLQLAKRGWDLHYFDLCAGNGGSVRTDGPTTAANSPFSMLSDRRSRACTPPFAPL